MKIRPVGTEMFHADEQTDIHDKVNDRFSQFCESAQILLVLFIEITSLISEKHNKIINTLCE
jgi:hypothetical protein